MSSARLLALVATASLWPATAAAKLPAPQPAGADPRGVTISGTGMEEVTRPERLTDATVREAVARARPAALAQAVADGRGRAEVVARSAGLTLGEVVTLSEDTNDPYWGFSGEERYCSRATRRRPRRCHVPPVVVVVVRMTFATAQTDQAGEPARTVTADGVGRAGVRPTDRDDERAIRAAVEAAAVAADAGAFGRAGADARSLAQAAGRTLGPLVSVAEDRTAPHAWPPGAAARVGTFEPGRFCGFRLRPVLRRDPRTGRRRVVRRVRVRRCTFPSMVVTRLRVTFATS